MQLGIDGQLNVGTRLPFATGQFAHDAACCVHLDLLCAGKPAQQPFLAGFDIDATDLKAGNTQHGIGYFLGIQIGLAHAADAPDDMGKIRPARIDPCQTYLWADTGQCGGIHGNTA